MKLFVVLLCLVFASSATADVVVEDAAGHTVDYDDVSGNNFLTLTADTMVATWGVANDTAVLTNSYWHDPKPTEKTHYIDGYDTTIAYDRIECDTAYTRDHFIDSTDTWIYQREVECDTVFVMEVRPAWKEKVAVLLNPDQLDALMVLLGEYGVLDKE